MINTYNFFGIPVSSLDFESLITWSNDTILSNGKKCVYGYSLYSIYAFNKIPEIYTLGSRADIFLADGRPFFWLCKFFNLPVKVGISIPQYVMMILKLANVKNYKVMLIGAEIEINKRAEKNIRIKYPGINLICGIDGYFRDNQICDVLMAIEEKKPDILLVGMSSPKKEKFVFNNLDKISAKIIIPCGGMIDVLAGKTKMTPEWLKRIGFAFLFRIIQEPKRLLMDRLKMLFFLFFRFFPMLLFWHITQNKDISIPKYYI